jgi:hypothetical protein
MTAIVLAARERVGVGARFARDLGPWRMLAATALVALAASGPEVRGILVTSLSDAFLQVSVFVAATMALVYGLERLFGFDAVGFLGRNRRWQVPVAALMGALPGCGGAIMVITQYLRGSITFGAVVAVLTSTMGDAAFLLLAREPATGLAVFALGFATGVVSGHVVDAIHGPDFLRGDGARQVEPECHGGAASPALRRLWLALVVPGLLVGALLALQIDVDGLVAAMVGPSLADHMAIGPTVVLGTTGALFALLLWGFLPERSDEPSADGGACPPGARRGRLDQVIADTNFVTAWVVMAYLLYELGIYTTGVDLKAVFELWAPLAPLAGVLVGFLPGCGPQIVVTTLYLGGVVPLSAQLGNAIGNDGDALFPAIALAPRAAVLATLYSAIPAVIVAYTYYWLWE